MSKEDIEVPDEIPAKRRQLEKAIDMFIAVWLTRDDLTPSQRRRLEEEKARRKQLRRQGPPVTVSFLGVREGLAPRQRKRLIALLAEHDPQELHHADRIGGDEQLNEVCLAMNIPVIVHPSQDARLRAHCQGVLRAEKALPDPEVAKALVRAGTLVLAAPRESQEPLPGRGSELWATLRYARSRDKRSIAVLPNGNQIPPEENT